MRIGQGFDVHPFDRDGTRSLVLGGVVFDGAPGLRGHSDADVVAHAVTDALLGAAGLGDIGTHFPDTDPTWAGVDSLELLRQALSAVRNAGWAPVNVDCTVITETPKLAPRRPEMEEKLSAAVGASGQREGEARRGAGRDRALRGHRVLRRRARRAGGRPMSPAKRRRCSGRRWRRQAARDGGSEARQEVEQREVDAGRRASTRGAKPVRDHRRAAPAHVKGLGGDQVEGRQAVRELLLGGRRVRELWVATDVDEADVVSDILELARELRVTVREVGRSKLAAEARTDSPQGVLAKAAPLREVELDELARGRSPARHAHRS